VRAHKQSYKLIILISLIYPLNFYPFFNLSFSNVSKSLTKHLPRQTNWPPDVTEERVRESFMLHKMARKWYISMDHRIQKLHAKKNI